MSDGEILMAEQGLNWTIWFKSTNGTASLNCPPGWKNTEGQTGYMDHNQKMVPGPIDPVTDANLNRIREIGRVSFVYLDYGFLTISFSWMPAPLETKEALLNLLTTMFGWDSYSIGYQPASVGMVASRLITGKR